jgi:hypothetical protein
MLEQTKHICQINRRSRRLEMPVTTQCYDAGMKAIARISAITALLSVAGLQSRGAWALVALAVGLVSVAVLVVACGRLGYFELPAAEERAGQVVYLEDRRRAAPGEVAPQAQSYRRGAGVRGR